MNRIVVLIIILVYLTILLWMKQHNMYCSHDILFVEPMWGLGNRLRVIRKAYALCNLLNRRLVIIHGIDDGFDHPDIKHLFKMKNINCISREEFERIKSRQCQLFTINNLEQRCESHVDIVELKTINTALYTNSCDIYNADIDKDTSFYRDVSSVFNNKDYRRSIRQDFKQVKNIETCSKIVGVHIRQGSVADYIYGNFFGHWDNKDLTMQPFFPQFEDKSKNLSATHPKAKPLEDYIDVMLSYDSSVMFFLCADRIGTLIYLHQIFPGRIVMNDLKLPSENPDSEYGLKDFLSLSKCDEIVVSKVGSFSEEASKVRNVPIIKI